MTTGLVLRQTWRHQLTLQIKDQQQQFCVRYCCYALSTYWWLCLISNTKWDRRSKRNRNEESLAVTLPLARGCAFCACVRLHLHFCDMFSTWLKSGKLSLLSALVLGFGTWNYWCWLDLRFVHIWYFGWGNDISTTLLHWNTWATTLLKYAVLPQLFSWLSRDQFRSSYTSQYRHMCVLKQAVSWSPTTSGNGFLAFFITYLSWYFSSCWSVCSSILNRPFSGAPSGENLLLRWTSYQNSLSEKHSFYGTLVGKLQQKD